MKQQAVRFGDNKSLSGIVTYPEKLQSGSPAVIFLTAGVIHRVGPNGLYTRLCRDLAARGFLTLRFDFSGIGDSPPREDHLLFSKSSILESKAAMDFLAKTTGAQRFVLAGLCSGAAAAVQTAANDARVSGAIVINAPTLQEGDHSDFQVYAANRSIMQHLMNPRTWLKVFDGTARYNGKLEIITSYLTGTLRKSRFSESTRAVTSQLQDLVDRKVDLLFIFSKGDPGQHYFELLGERAIGRLMQTGHLSVEVISGTDHIFAPPDALQRLLHVCGSWMGQHSERADGPSRSSTSRQPHLPELRPEPAEIAPDSSLTHASRA